MDVQEPSGKGEPPAQLETSAGYILDFVSGQRVRATPEELEAVQVFAVPELRFTLPRDAFWPVPGVDSALVTLAVRGRPAVDVPDMSAFFAFAERIFQFRRKQLGGILARLGGAEAGEKLRETGIDPKRRPQTLSLAEWETLHRAFRARG